MSPPKVAIIGAGPAGLTLARLLQVAKIPCTVYDLETGPTARGQGGTLDLHPKSGQLALKECGLMEEFKKHARPEGECMKVIAPTGEILWDENEMGNHRPDEDSDRPEIDRVVLRDILLNSLKPGTIEWDRKLLRVEQTAGDRHKWDLIFANKTERGFDLVVGADGAWSKVRPLLTDEKPFYSSVTAIELWALDVDTKNPWLSNYVGNGNAFMFDQDRALLCQRNGNGSIRAYASVRQPETWSTDCGIDWTKPTEARKELIERYFNDCGDDLKRVISECTDELIVRAAYMLPVGIKWESRPGVTLMGDAAHLMTPFAGVGVNVAMADALDLAQALIAKRDSFTAKAFSDKHNIAEAIKSYEETMFVRGEQNAQKTWKNLQGHFGKGGGEHFAGRLRKGYEMRMAEQGNK